MQTRLVALLALAPGLVSGWWCPCRFFLTRQEPGPTAAYTPTGGAKEGHRLWALYARVLGFFRFLLPFGRWSIVVFFFFARNCGIFVGASFVALGELRPRVFV